MKLKKKNVLFSGTTYFFKGKHFWQFDDMRMRVAHKKPKSSAHFWMNCPRGIDTNDVDFEHPTKNRFTFSNKDANSAVSKNPSLYLVLTIAFALLTFFNKSTT